MKYKRKCPNCNRILFYNNKWLRNRATKNKSFCKHCFHLKFDQKSYKEKLRKRFSGKNNPMYGKHHTDETKQKCRNAALNQILTENQLNILKNYWKGKKRPESTRIKMRKPKSKDHCEKIKNFRMGKTFEEIYGIEKSKEIKRKIGISSRKRLIAKIQKNYKNNLPIYPIFNKQACKIINDYGKQNNYNFQHAMNGGEHYIPELGYWIDGYDKDKNTVIEYYEPFHKKQIEKDKKRKQEIKDFLKCKFIEIREWELKK